MNKTGVIFALIFDDKILMQKRDKNCSKFPYRWCLPGGGTEKEEDATSTLLREVKEECDVDLNLNQCSYLMDYSNGANNKVYVCRVKAGQNIAIKEGEEMKWMTIDEIERLDLGFNQNEIIPVIKAKYFAN